MSVIHLIASTFAQRFFLHMKKILFLLVLSISGSAVIWGLNGQINEMKDSGSQAKEEESTAYVAKYRDCIAQGDFPMGMALERPMDGAELGPEIEKYGASLRQVIDNLNYIEAHNHIHQEFQHYVSKLEHPALTPSQRDQYLKILH